MATYCCTIHGSFNKHFAEIQWVRQLFVKAHITVLAPAAEAITSIEQGFARFEYDKNHDYRLIELNYLHNLLQLGKQGFCYFVNPDGYLGPSAAYELGLAHAMGIPCYFSANTSDHPAYQPEGSVRRPEDLVEHLQVSEHLPDYEPRGDEARIHQLWRRICRPL